MGNHVVWELNKPCAITHRDTSKWQPDVKNHVSLHLILTDCYEVCTIVVMFDASCLLRCPFVWLFLTVFSLLVFRFLSSECCRRKHRDHLLSTGCSDWALLLGPIYFAALLAYHRSMLPFFGFLHLPRLPWHASCADKTGTEGCFVVNKD